MDKENKLPYSFWIEPELKTKLEQAAEEHKISEGLLIRRAIERYLRWIELVEIHTEIWLDDTEKVNKRKRCWVAHAQKDIIEGFQTLEEYSEGYRQHDAFEAIGTSFTKTYDSFFKVFRKKNPI